MWKNILLSVLWLALILELGMTVGGFAAPGMLLSKFTIAADPGTMFLSHVVAWFLLLVTVLIGLALWFVHHGDPLGWKITLLLGGWWLPLGISIYVFFGRPDNLFLDSLKGLILIIAAHKSCPSKQPTTA